MKLLIGIVFLLFLVMVVLFYSLLKNRGKEVPVPTPLITPHPTFFQPEGDRILISGISMKNFYSFAKTTNDQGDVLIVDTQNYQIVYLAQFNQFLVSILSSSFDQVRLTAENQFLDLLGITKDQACKLSVEISTPVFIDPEKTDDSYPLSFCEKK